jgi:ankyrin repeat protein
LERLSLFALPRSTGDEDKDDNEPDSAAAAGSTHGTDSEILVEPDSDWGNALLEAVRLGDLPIVKEKLIDNHLFNEASRETLGDPQNRSVVTTPGDLLDLERLLEATRGQLSLAPGPYTFLADELRTLEIVVAEIKEQITNRELENDIKDDLQTSVLSCERVLGGIWDKGSADEANRLRSRLISSIQRFDAVRHRLDSTYQADRYQGDQIEGYCTTALIEGASRGHKEIVDVLLDAGAHINGTAHGSAALQAASSAGNASMVRSLCRRGADVNQPADDETPLMAASLVKASDVVAELVKFGADVNAVLGDETALIGASFVGAVDVVSLLIEAGADPNITTDSTEHGTALIAASSRGAIDVVQVLLDAGADVNAEAGGNTALSTACKYGGLGLATVELLLQHGADVNSQPASGHTALWKAAAEGHGDTVKLLLNAGADISKGGSFGSPLNAAIWNVHETVVDMLIEAGADVNSVSGVYTALESASKFGRDEIVRKLLAAGANPKSFTHAGHFHSPLHSAAGCGMDAVVKLLLKAGAPIDETDSSGKAALHIACRSGIERIVEILIEAGANLDVPSDDGTPLEIAKEKRYTDIVDKLARARANRLRASLLAQSIPKFAQVERGSVVTQSWTLQNPGPRSWPAGCVLYHSDGAEMPRLDDGTHGRPSPLKPGESAVLTIQVQAPDNPGRCVAFWGLKDPDGMAFGDRLPIDLQVT